MPSKIVEIRSWGTLCRLFWNHGHHASNPTSPLALLQALFWIKLVFNLILFFVYLYYNYEKYPLSTPKPRSLALIEQYLPNISDPMYSVQQSFMWFLWLNWRKSTFYPVTAPNNSKCWPIVTSSIQEPVASNCDVTMTRLFPRGCYGRFLSIFCDPRVSTRGIASIHNFEYVLEAINPSHKSHDPLSQYSTIHQFVT